MDGTIFSFEQAENNCQTSKTESGYRQILELLGTKIFRMYRANCV